MISEIEAEDTVMLVLLAAATNAEGVRQYNIHTVPDEPDDKRFAALGLKGAILVQHGQITYGEVTPSVRAEEWQQTAAFDISCMVGARSMRRSDGHHGALEMLQFVRNVLSGLVLARNNDSPVALYPVLQYFVKQQDRVYWYRIMFRANDVFKKPTQ